MTKTSVYRTEIKIKASYDEIQIIDVENWNKRVKEMNRYYDEIDNTESGEMIVYWNRQINILKDVMKSSKPNWIK